jgi:hypothetical protein
MVGMVGHGNKSSMQKGDYKRDSMWFYPPDPTVLAAVSPSDAYYKRKVLLVCPEYATHGVMPKAPCPSCGKMDRVKREGWDPYGRKVYDLSDIYYLIGFQYHSTCCNKHYAAWNPESVKYWPREQQLKMPCVVLHRSAVDRRVVDMMGPLLDHGLGFQAIEKLIKEQHLIVYHELCEAPYYFGLDRRSKANVLDFDNLLASDSPAGRKKFSAFSDPSGYAGSTPSDTLLQSVWLQVSESREHFYHRRQQQVGGEVCSGDGSHKFVSIQHRQHVFAYAQKMCAWLLHHMRMHVQLHYAPIVWH